MGVWYTNGLFKFKNTYLYINPGIGLEPGPAYIRVRFWCRPEITLIRLTNQKAGVLNYQVSA
jgi:predicted MPP superfamily phosphohydrolase